MNEFLQDYKQTKLFVDIENQIKNGTFSHSNLIVCDDDFTAKLFSKLIAMTILCERNEACSVCSHCLQVLSEVHADLFVFPKGKNFVVLDSEQIIEKAYTKPIHSDKKVFLINDFDNANVASQNKVLKIFEEPSENTFFVLNAKNSRKILPTIKSRMQIINIPAFSLLELKQILQKHNLTSSEVVLSFSNGFLGQALSLLENKNFISSYDFVLDTIKNMQSSKDLIKFSPTLADKNTFVLKLEIFERVFRNILVFKTGKKNLLDEIEVLNIQNIEKEFSVNAIIKILNKIIEAKTYFEANVNLNSICDELLLGILEVKYLWK